MGLTADLFVAEADDARRYEALRSKGPLPRDKYEGAAFAGLTNLNFEILWSILEAQAWNLKAHSLELVSLEGGGETWLFRFPQPLVTKLSSLGPPEMTRAAELWSKTAELRCKPSEIAPVVHALVGLARSAATTGKGLFLWGAL
jgi:hypothetical protein